MRLYDEIWETVTVRGNEVRVTLREISLCRKAKILLEDHDQFMKPTKSLIGDSLNLRGKPISENQTTRQIWIYPDHSTLDSMRQGMKEEKNRMRLPHKVFKGMRMIMRQHSSCKIPHQRGPSYEAQPDMHLRQERAPIKDMAREKEKYQ
ncbi:hypothetical protein Godav_002423 [Gossypium davidsonii]|uniref:Uncharacterized protein n=2 Tax=Gossypium TaxID=3633 RepID=A0A7J8SW42_GOSDV|nr:hypothetical protein [Gossypium davidsonii]MBA0666023.1 hypothetical protein [Gossypium klotzschianum]